MFSAKLTNFSKMFAIIDYKVDKNILYERRSLQKYIIMYDGKVCTIINYCKFIFYDICIFIQMYIHGLIYVLWVLTCLV